MASACGLYDVMWHPENIFVAAEECTASYYSPYLLMGINKLVRDKESMEKLNPENGWGDYDGLLDFACAYYMATIRHPDAKIRISI